jgi:hypothetical protein
VGIGAVLLAEIWKAVLDFQVASRVVKAELFRNEAMLNILRADPARAPSVFLVDEALSALRTHLAFLMAEQEWRTVALHYTVLSTLNFEIQQARATKTLPNLTAIQTSAKEILEAIEIPREVLEQMSKRRRRTLLLDALRGRATSPAVLSADG